MLYELIAVNRLNVSEQTSLRYFPTLQEAEREAKARQQSNPLDVFYVFYHLSPELRLMHSYYGL